eukprot:1809570-Rhodomonas_salina.4
MASTASKDNILSHALLKKQGYQITLCKGRHDDPMYCGEIVTSCGDVITLVFEDNMHANLMQGVAGDAILLPPETTSPAPATTSPSLKTTSPAPETTSAVQILYLILCVKLQSTDIC